MTRILLVELGAGALPAPNPLTPAAATWAPAVYVQPPVPVPGSFAATALVDGVLLSWAAVAGDGVVYAVERAPDSNNAPGAWSEVARVTALQYPSSVANGVTQWWRVRAVRYGRTSAYTDALKAAAVNGSTLRSDATNALAQLTDIASDSLLTPVEKPTAVRERDVIVAEQAGIDTQAAAYGIGTERTNYNNAVKALTDYLATLTAPTAWDNFGGNTNIVGATFRQKFADVYTTRQKLLDAIVSKAKGLASAPASARGLVRNANFRTRLLGNQYATRGVGHVIVDDWIVQNKAGQWAFLLEADNVLFRIVSGAVLGNGAQVVATLQGAPFDVDPNEEMRFGFRMTAAWLSSPPAGVTTLIRLYINYYDAADAYITQHSVDLGRVDSEASADSIVPANAKQARLFIQGIFVNNSGATYTAGDLPYDARVLRCFALVKDSLANDVRGRLTASRRLPQIMVGNGRAKVATTISYTASAGSPATATISVGAFTLLSGASTSYNASSVGTSGDGGTTVRYFLYMDDPDYVGGARTLVATTDGNAVYQSVDRIYIGNVDVAYPTSGTSSGDGGRVECVAFGMMFDADTFVEDARAGYLSECIDLPTSGLDRFLRRLRAVRYSPMPCVRLTTEGGKVKTVSTSTPFDLPDGRIVFAQDMLGELVVTDTGPGTALHIERVASVVDAGVQMVCRFDFGGCSFPAGEDPFGRIYSHNATVKP